MKNLFSSKMRILCCFWLVLLAALLLVCWFYYQSLKKELSSEAQKRADQSLHLVHWMLGQKEGIERADQLHKYLTDLGREMGFRITYIAPGGRVTADSEVPYSHLDSLDNHASRPEVIQARSQETGFATRFSRTSQEELIYLAETISLNSSAAPGVVRVAIPYSPFKSRFNRLSKVFIVTVLLAFVVIAAISYALIRQLDKPIQTMIAATEAIGQGDYRQRVRFQPGHEFYLLARSINTTAELIDRQIQTISEQKQQLEAIFNGMKEGLMVLDSQGKLKDLNMAMAEIIPFAVQNIGRRPLEATMSLDLQKACDHVLSNSGGDSGDYPHSLQIALRGGESIYDVTIVRLADGSGGAGAIAVFHDISELKRLEKVRQDFVANVSHELRTPLTSIKGYTETLLSQQSPDPEALFSFLQVILRNTDHMVKMVDDLLQLARLEAQSGQTQTAVVDAVE
ncbi:MAG: histidine kinase dimerization/phospho-acceptor domain-containing protein, partial [Desulforhabdus sp.]|nr:histidine kinase dimerization/phospho-acceptor domain-containing protein [Desulforhabdus sp.]